MKEWKRHAAIVLAAGKGSRMKCDVPKQYLSLKGKPVLYYALKAFEESFIDEIVLVFLLPASRHRRAQRASCQKRPFFEKASIYVLERSCIDAARLGMGSGSSAFRPADTVGLEVVVPHEVGPEAQHAVCDIAVEADTLTMVVCQVLSELAIGVVRRKEWIVDRPWQV